MSANGKRPHGGATRLIRDLDHLTDSFAGVSALRRAIFEIAVAGELTAGTPQPAWRRVPLADFGEFSGGSTPSKARGAFWGGDVPWISPKDMKTPEIGDTEDKVTRLALSEGRLRLLPTGSVVLVVRSGILRRTVPVAVTTVSATLNQDMKGLIPRADIDPRFVRLLLRGCERTILETYVKGGTTVQSIKWDQLLALELPLPPLAEQQRIVAKVDQLMALCDDLEAKQTKKRDLATQSTRSALTALTTAENADDLAAAWSRIQTRFENFVSRPDDVALLRQACIELAVRGRLAGGLPSDGSGQDLLRKIREENQKAGKAKNPRQGEANVTEAAQPFQIPSHWVWVCWRDLFQSSEAGWSPQCASRPRAGDEWGVLKVSAVSWDRFDPDENKALLPGVEPRRDYAVQVGDFLMSRANTAALVGRSVVVAQQPTRLLMSDKTIRCHFSPLVDRSFMNYYNRTDTARQHYVANASGTSDSMKNISRDVILDMPAPLPPLAEQKRIVAKVDHLMSLLDDLEAKLRKQEETATRLAESLAAAVAA